MASLRKRGKVWRAELYRNGQRESATFHTKGEAAAWALRREAELEGRRSPDKTLRDALERYSKEVCPTHKGERWEVIRLEALGRLTIASKRLQAIAAPDIAEWRDKRLKDGLQPSSVAREWNLLRSVFEVARTEWHWIHANPMLGVKRPSSPPSRRRRVTDEEVDRIVAELGYKGGKPRTLSDRVALAFKFALETAMRAGEILGLRWEDIHPTHAVLPRTKNGDAREVPLSKAARDILALLPGVPGPVFGLLPHQRDALFRKARDAAGVVNLRFHDSRAEAIWRMSKKLDVLELARVIGHRDIRSLMIYYQTTAAELAARLDATPATPQPPQPPKQQDAA